MCIQSVQYRDRSVAWAMVPSSGGVSDIRPTMMQYVTGAVSGSPVFALPAYQASRFMWANLGGQRAENPRDVHFSGGSDDNANASQQRVNPRVKIEC